MTNMPTTTAKKLKSMNDKKNKIPAPHLGQLLSDYPVFGAIGTRLMHSLPHIWGSQAILGIFLAPFLCALYISHLSLIFWMCTNRFEVFYAIQTRPPH